MPLGALATAFAPQFIRLPAIGGFGLRAILVIILGCGDNALHSHNLAGARGDAFLAQFVIRLFAPPDGGALLAWLTLFEALARRRIIILIAAMLETRAVEINACFRREARAKLVLEVFQADFLDGTLGKLAKLERPKEMRMRRDTCRP